MVKRQFRRFRDGETCAECPARRWYVETGHGYCERGHQIEGFIQFDVDVEGENFGRMGKIVRKKKERLEQERKLLEGKEGVELYLHSLQVVLRKQVAWLVQTQGVAPELEDVCRQLWDLRIRNFAGLTSASEGRAQQDAGGGPLAMPSADGDAPPVKSGSDSERVEYSSQGESTQASSSGADDEDGPSSGDGGGGRKRQTKKTWHRSRNWSGEGWVFPGSRETLAIVYLGCLLRQEPIRIGDLARWAKSGQIPFLGAVSFLPRLSCSSKVSILHDTGTGSAFANKPTNFYSLRWCPKSLSKGYRRLFARFC